MPNMKKCLSLIITLLFLSSLSANEASILLKEYNLETLQPNQLLELKEYLVDHAANSKQPIVPGF